MLIVGMLAVIFIIIGKLDVFYEGKYNDEKNMEDI